MFAREQTSTQSLDYGGLPVLHFFHQFHSLGGVESILQVHYDFDHKIGVQSDFIIYLEPPTASRERLHCLGLDATEPMRAISQKLDRITQQRPGRTAIYHLSWGANFLCPHDHSSRRLFVAHGKNPTILNFLKRHVRFFDGVLCVNDQILERVQQTIPHLSTDRICNIRCPIRPPATARASESLSGPILLGYIGRLQVPHKRIDRIPEFCGRLADLGTDFQMHLLGSGPDRSLLENSGAVKYYFKGELRGDAYWRSVQELDAVVFFSDTEGTPVALIEALSQGVIPIYPQIDSGGDSYVKMISPDLLYSPGDMKAAAHIVQRLSNSASTYIAELRTRCRQAVAEHSVSAYLRDTFDFTKHISELPRISANSPGISMRFLQFLSPTQTGKIRELLSGGRDGT
jgi:glycosyltransferase involved in cell wall biosynthesis